MLAVLIMVLITALLICKANKQLEVISGQSLYTD